MVENQGDHATFFNWGITFEEGTFIYKLFNKRDSLSFSVVSMPHIESIMPQNIFYSAIKGEFWRIARSTLYPGTLYIWLKNYWTSWINRVTNVVPQELL